MPAPVYSWEIEGLDCYPTYEGQSNVVATVRYRRIQTYNGETTHLSALIDVRKLTLGPFVPFDSLTPDTVNTWVYAAIGPAGVQALDHTLYNPILANAKDQVPTTPPWSA